LGSLGVAGLGRSLFFPDIELARFSIKAHAAGVFGVFGGRLAVFSKITLILAK
jgi:hypothetical protein